MARDSEGRQWRFEAPFYFLNPDGQRGSPQWPLSIPGDPERNRGLESTDQAAETAAWEWIAGVDASVFELPYKDWD